MKRLLGLLVLAAATALAADRHVFLDTDGDLKVNQCPNPAHNTFASPSTGNLERCVGGANDGKVRGDKSGYVTTCPSGAFDTINVDGTESSNIYPSEQSGGDAGSETIYGHPQACLWNASVSDSCEVHAGTYKKAGFGQGNEAHSSGTANVCGQTDCFTGSIGAFGYGANFTAGNNSYGTAGSPFFVRGAVMNGSTDTWDSDGDKIPDCNTNTGTPVCTVPGEPPSYFPTMSGDRDEDGITRLVSEATSCSGADASTCTGDSFFAIFAGCGTGSFGGIQCSSPDAGEMAIQVDTNADGTFDTELTAGAKNVDFIEFKDLEFVGFNGGNVSSGGGGSAERHLSGRVNLVGDGSSQGLTVNHLWQHGSGFQVPGGDVKNISAEWGDYLNSGCRTTNATNYTRWINSLVEVNQRYFLQSDNDESGSGCSHDVHGNRVIWDFPSNAVGQPNNGTNNGNAVIAFYLKPIDHNGGGNKKEHRIYNNEFILVNTNGATDKFFFTFAGMGRNCPGGLGLGEVWFYGNVIRKVGSGSVISEFNQGYCGCDGGCSPCGGSGRIYDFNNTWDWAVPKQGYCENSAGPQEFYRDINNAYFGMTNLFDDGSEMGTVTHSTNCVSTSDPASDVCGSNNTKSNWYADTTTTATVYNGLTLYAAKTSGALDGVGSCDPDGDGVAGVDYDGDHVNDTTWTDIAGNVINCPTVGTALDVGAIQSSTAGGGASCGNNVVESGETCDCPGGASCNGQICATLVPGSTGTVSCTACTAFDVSLCVGAPKPKLRGARLRGAILR